MTTRTCGKPGCRGVVRDDVCSVCGPVVRTGWKEDRWRGSRIERGYDQAWLDLRRAFIEQKTEEAALLGLSAYPMCDLCKRPVDVVREIHVDHIEPFDGVDDPRRLDIRNLRIMHMRCHMQRTARQAHPPAETPPSQVLPPDGCPPTRVPPPGRGGS